MFLEKGQEITISRPFSIGSSHEKADGTSFTCLSPCFAFGKIHSPSITQDVSGEPRQNASVGAQNSDCLPTLRTPRGRS